MYSYYVFLLSSIGFPTWCTFFLCVVLIVLLLYMFRQMPSSGAQLYPSILASIGVVFLSRLYIIISLSAVFYTYCVSFGVFYLFVYSFWGCGCVYVCVFLGVWL